MKALKNLWSCTKFTYSCVYEKVYIVQPTVERYNYTLQILEVFWLYKMYLSWKKEITGLIFY